jgi:TatD DNase family protein
MPDYSFADAHCHLDCYAGEILPDILHITCGYSMESNRKNASVAERNPNVHLCAGISPQDAMKNPQVKIQLSEWEEEISSLPRLVAIGEIGLDFHWAKTEQERFLQNEAFISQLVLAERLNLPVVVHSRGAEAECLDILRNFNIPFMLHCFGGKAQDAIAAAGLPDSKAIVSVPPLRSRERREFISALPLERLVAETDAPYIGKAPSDAMESIKMIAEIKQQQVEAVQFQLLKNTIKFFNII